MTRHRKTDAHIATIRVSVPIMPTDWRTIVAANEAINGLSAHLPPGSTVEVLNSRFGRVDAAVVAPTTGMADLVPLVQGLSQPPPEPVKYGVGPVMGTLTTPTTQLDIESTLAAVREQVTAGAVDPLEPPESLRRVPRRDPYNGATPMDPSGDGSYRGPDGAR